MNSLEYIEVTVKFSPFSQERAEIVEACLSDLPYNSFVIGDDCLKAYIQKEDYDARMLKIVLSDLDFETTFSADLMLGRNWNSLWESHSFNPTVIGGCVTIKPWSAKGVPKTRYNISIRPNMAFGTGYHQTTSMMITSMLENASLIKGKRVLDMGCGTGVLAILAAKMGAEKTWAIDIDAVAAQSAFDNSYHNRVSPKIECVCGDASLLQAGWYDVILANIHRNIILMDTKTYAMGLKKGGMLTVSGFYESDAPDIIKEAAKNSLTLSKESSLEGWSCLTFSKEG